MAGVGPEDPGLVPGRRSLAHVMLRAAIVVQCGMAQARSTAGRILSTRKGDSEPDPKPSMSRETRSRTQALPHADFPTNVLCCGAAIAPLVWARQLYARPTMAVQALKTAGGPKGLYELGEIPPLRS